MAHSRTTLENIHDRFWSKVVQDPVRDCWVWSGTRGRGGYGAFWIPRDLIPDCLGGRMHATGRVLAYLINGAWPGSDVDACHKCDNPPCVKPDHLFLGTTLENMQDMARKGRASRAGAPGGERHPDHKLKDAQVLEITLRARAGERPTALAREFGVSQGLVSMYRNGTRRKDITGPSNVVEMSKKA